MRSRNYPIPSSTGVPAAPISDAQRRMLHKRVADLHGTAKRKGYTLSTWDYIRESDAARTHFEVGAWGYWAHLRRDRLTVEDRARVTFALLASGKSNIDYEFFTAFDFGERQLDAFFEMGDADEVIEAIGDIVRRSGHAVAAEMMKQLGWSFEERQTALILDPAAA